MKKGSAKFLMTLAVSATLTAACNNGPACGPGTVGQNGKCVALNGGCSDGELLLDGKCIPPLQCGVGTEMLDGRCVPNLECGAGTAAEAGACLPASLPTADILESTVPEGAVPFTLPLDGEQVVLGGVIDTPIDLNDDGFTDPDWDEFTFTGTAGTYLRLTALSGGALLASFRISSATLTDDGLPQYVRWVFDVSAADAGREVYLPRDDDYVIAVSDTNHVMRSMARDPVLPIGGDSFVYRVRVENLGEPQVQAADTLPHEEVGNVADGALHFVSVKGGVQNYPLAFAAKGRPDFELWNDVIPAVMVFDGSGHLVAEAESPDTWRSADLLLRAGAGSSLLAVHDVWAVTGPERSYRFRVEQPRRIHCVVSDCGTLTFAEQEHVLLQWDLLPGDFLAGGVYLPETSYRAVNVTLVDDSLAHLNETQPAFFPINTASSVYAETAGPRYMWLREFEGVALEEVFTDVRILSTPELVPGNDYTGLTVSGMPPYTFYPAGVSHVSAGGGKVVFFSDFTPQGSTWYSPNEMLLDAQMNEMGGVIDLDAWNFPDGRVTPPFVWLRPGAHALHMVMDPNGDPMSGGTYDIKVRAYQPTALGTVTPTTPARLTSQGLGGGFSFYAVDTGEGMQLSITVTPGLISSLQPKIWVMNYGRAEWDWIYYVWNADPQAPQLGLVAQDTAGGNGQALTLTHVSPYDGPSLILVMDGEGTAGILDTYSIDVTASPALSNN